MRLALEQRQKRAFVVVCLLLSKMIPNDCFYYHKELLCLIGVSIHF